MSDPVRKITGWIPTSDELRHDMVTIIGPRHVCRPGSWVRWWLHVGPNETARHRGERCTQGWRMVRIADVFADELAKGLLRVSNLFGPAPLPFRLHRPDDRFRVVKP